MYVQGICRFLFKLAHWLSLLDCWRELTAMFEKSMFSLILKCHGATCGAVSTNFHSSLPSFMNVYFSSTKRYAGLLFKCGDNRRFPKSERAEDPQQFPSVQLGDGWYGHLDERHHRCFLQLPEVSDVTTPFHNVYPGQWPNEMKWPNNNLDITGSLSSMWGE